MCPPPGEHFHLFGFEVEVDGRKKGAEGGRERRGGENQKRKMRSEDTKGQVVRNGRMKAKTKQ